MNRQSLKILMLLALLLFGVGVQGVSATENGFSQDSIQSQVVNDTQSAGVDTASSPVEDGEGQDKTNDDTLDAVEVPGEMNNTWVNWLSLGIAMIALMVSILFYFRLLSKYRRLRENFHDLEYNLSRSKSSSSANTTSYTGGRTVGYGQPRNPYSASNTPYRGGSRNETEKKNGNKEKTSKTSNATKQERQTPVPAQIHEYASVTQPHQGVFNKVSADPDNKKVFVISSNPGQDAGTFDINPNISDDFKREIIQNRTSYLPNNFCEIQSINANPTTISSVTQGKAIKENGKWKVVDRLVINLV